MSLKDTLKEQAEKLVDDAKDQIEKKAEELIEEVKGLSEKGPPARVRRRALVKRKPNAKGDYTPDVESVQPRKLGCPTPLRAGLNFVRCDNRRFRGPAIRDVLRDLLRGLCQIAARLPAPPVLRHSV